MALKGMQDNSVDSVVTDPPYGISFMNKKWDYDVPSVDVWKEVLRVLKPGGHILCACGTRTQHRMTVNIEDAGFEIRDVIAWIYGSGFPKSLNIGKAVDGLQGNEREAVGEKTLWGHNAGTGAGSFSKNQYEGQTGLTRVETLTKGTSEFEGWGTALKPAMELWTLARKPLSEKTIAENCLEWGTGGINIDGCRVETDEQITNHSRGSESAISKGKYGDSVAQETHQTIGQQSGRFPANVIHDGSGEIVNQFPYSKSTGGRIGNKNGAYAGIGASGFTTEHAKGDPGFGDDGSASRFFYCAKASKSERNKGLENFADKYLAGSNQAKAELKRGNIDFRGTGDGESGWLQVKATKNNHPTVKPVSLMQYLCRLITPPKGIVLDPFMGSGSTGIGAKLEGFSFIGIEREKEYCDIADARIRAWETDAHVKLDTLQQTLVFE
jgi:site-specific DNA-methyltransferase (adenine-specific)